jgi:hypothetical protein
VLVSKASPVGTHEGAVQQAGVDDNEEWSVIIAFPLESTRMVSTKSVTTSQFWPAQVAAQKAAVVPTQAPVASHVSLKVHLLPSLQLVPGKFVCVHVAVPLHAYDEQRLFAGHVAALPTQWPAPSQWSE